jgi:hypothetical protein
LTVWGFHRAHDIEVIHNRFCRFVLKIGKNVPTAFLYGELGHLLGNPVSFTVINIIIQ